MSLFAKIGRLIKQNKLYEIEENSSHVLNIKTKISEFFHNNNEELIFNNFIKNDSELEKARNIIEKCSQEKQMILITLLEIQLSLLGNELNYIKYEKMNEKIIEKNLYWVITKEIHKRAHENKTKENNDIEIYCHCEHDQKEKYILGKEYNFRYDNLDSIICKLKNNNKNIEYIGIKSIFISFYNISIEYVEKYIDIYENSKKDISTEYLLFDFIINDYSQIIQNIKFLEEDFYQSSTDFKQNTNLNFTFADLFKDIFFNTIFHSQPLGTYYIHGFIYNDNNYKKALLDILNIINSNKIPLCKYVSKILDIEKIINFKFDLTSQILKKPENFQICFGVKTMFKKQYSDIKDKICPSSKKENIIMNKIIDDFTGDGEKNMLKKDNGNKKDENKMKKKVEEIVDLENKSLDEVYQYISQDNKVKNRKKNKKRNGKKKGKKKNIEEQKEKNNEDYDEDPIVLEYKKDINKNIIFANAITKLKPKFSEKWIKEISQL